MPGSDLAVASKNGEESPLARQVNRYPITAEMQNRLEQSFTYHPPQDDQVDRYHAVRQEALLFALRIVQSTPIGREQDLALTNLEEAVFFANAAIARGE